MGNRKDSPPAVNKACLAWMPKLSTRAEILLSAASALCMLVALTFFFGIYAYFIVASEVSQAASLLILVYKLTTHKTCSGISARSQILTAIYSAVRLGCLILLTGGLQIQYWFDGISLLSTLWIIYMVMFKLKSTYVQELDNFPLYYLLVPCAVLAVFVHPGSGYASIFTRVPWAFCVYLEAISVVPQMRMMQNIKAAEPFTAHYLFALGVSRLLGCTHWILMIYATSGAYVKVVGPGGAWVAALLISEMVQTFILADFCYYYVKSVINGKLLVAIPLPV